MHSMGVHKRTAFPARRVAASGPGRQRLAKISLLFSQPANMSWIPVTKMYWNAGLSTFTSATSSADRAWACVAAPTHGA